MTSPTTAKRLPRSSPESSPRGGPPDWLVRLVHLSVAAYRAIDEALLWFTRSLRLAFQNSRKKKHSRHPQAEKSDPGGDAEPDITIGPILTRSDAPLLFEILEDLARRMDGAFPSEVRLSYLPACGVLDLEGTAGYKRQVLIVGLPCFLILRVDELRAVLAHELAHLHLEHNDRVRNIADFGSQLPSVSDSNLSVWVRPRCLLARIVGARLARLAAWISHAMEYRADAVSAHCFGTRPLASALEKLAIVQPLFRETLLVYDPIERPFGSVYQFFAHFWKGMDREQYRRLRKRFVKNAETGPYDTHPPIYVRIRRLCGQPWTSKRRPSSATLLLESPNELMAVMHNRLYGTHSEPDSVFRRFPDTTELN